MSALRTRAALQLGTALLACLAACNAWADQKVVSGNFGTLSASVQLKFNIAVGKFVSLRVGSADATVSDVNFAVDFSPVRPAGNSQAYSGSIAPGLMVTTTTTNPTSTSGALAVAAYTNVTGTTLACTLGPLAGATALVSGATAAGVPGRSDIVVGSGGAGTVQHPGTSLDACTGAVTTPIPMMTNMTGTFTYSTGFAPTGVLAGTYGNTVTYTATTL